MSDQNDAHLDKSADEDPKAHRRPSGALLTAAATVIAAVIAGVFTLIATHSSGGSQPAGGIATVLAPLPSGASEVTMPTGSGGSTGGTFLADLTAVTSPDSSNYADTVGGRSIIKAVGLRAGDEAEYAIPAGAKNFEANVGLSDNSVSSGDTGSFSVFGDNRLLGQASLKVGQLATLLVSVAGYKVLRIGFSSNNSSTYGDFGMARFTS